MTNTPSPIAGKAPGETSYALGSEDRAGEIANRIRSRFRVRAHGPSEDGLIYLDTPDWRIHRSGRELSRRAPAGNGGPAVLELCNGVGTVSREPIESVPGFAWDLPEGRLRDALTPVVEARRLLPQIELTARTTALDLLDEREKTVVRLVIEDGCLGGSGGPRPLRGVLRVQPLRGYDRQCAELVRFVLEELGLSATAESGLVRALAAAGRDPAREVPRWRVRLDRGERAGRAVRRVLLRLLEVMEANEEGLLADVDTEFLHDFRVAVRRARSILGQMKKVLPPPELDHFRSELAWLGQLTAGVRDLDVFQLQARVRPELAPLREHLTTSREQLRGRMVEGLRSGHYRELRRVWRSFLERPRHTADPPPADRPIEQVASRRIGKLHRGIVSRAGVLSADTPAAELHALRIECKKLRYMVDAFGCLYAGKRVARLIKQLKRLQDALGDFNDVEVQRVRLNRAASEVSGAHPDVLLALGGILERLRQRAAEMRPRILERLARFAASQDAGAMKRLLQSGG